MQKHHIEEIIDNIDDKYIYEANFYMEKRNKVFNKVMRKVGTIAACFVAFILLSVSTLTVATAAGSILAYDILYSLYPEVAQNLTPVNVSCEDNGIRMKVESANIDGNTAEIYISMKDLEDNRIDETIDLFDSYNIHTSSDMIGTCAFVDYDEELSQATFLIKLQHMDNKPIVGKKLTFSISKFLSGKQEMERKLTELSLEEVEEPVDMQTDVNIRGMGGVGNGTEQLGITEFLCVNEEQSFSPAAGVTVTAYGFIEERLHIQVYYEDILNTDNHGYVYLKDENGNVVSCNKSIAFWDKDESGSYEEYIFEIAEVEELNQYEVWGYFNTCENLIVGDWEVTFPIQAKE